VSGILGAPYDPANPLTAGARGGGLPNAQYVRPGRHTFNTPLEAPEEAAFQAWLAQNKVPFDPAAQVTDYDMRGFYRALQAGDQRAVSAINPNDQQLHYPDYWKTPFHETFSRDSQWATPDAPAWNDQDQLVDARGNVVFDERARR
jgi:hypothetical protein